MECTFYFNLFFLAMIYYELLESPYIGIIVWLLFLPLFCNDLGNTTYQQACGCLNNYVCTE